MTQKITFSFFRLRGTANRYWAFKEMQLAHKHFSQIEGLVFYKLLGTGGDNGFMWYPDFSFYGLLCVWEDEAAANDFLSSSDKFAEYRERSDEEIRFWLRPLEAHGKWSGGNPFATSELEAGKPIAVLTRATISLRHLGAFWSTVKQVSKELEASSGKLFSVGIGEWPLVQQATFSIWNNMRDMKDFAYRSRHHKEVVSKTRRYGWFKEEMFARFQVEKVEGTYNGSPVRLETLDRLAGTS